jgi:hypothetical protein
VLRIGKISITGTPDGKRARGRQDRRLLHRIQLRHNNGVPGAVL